MNVPSSPPHDGTALRPPKLLERMRIDLCTLHYSSRTEQSYLDWVRRFVLYHNKRHPQEMSAQKIEEFLSHLTVDRRVSASTQNQTKAVILDLYRQVLGVELAWLDEVVQAKRPHCLPVVLTPAGAVRAGCMRQFLEVPTTPYRGWQTSPATITQLAQTGHVWPSPQSPPAVRCVQCEAARRARRRLAAVSPQQARRRPASATRLMPSCPWRAPDQPEECRSRVIGRFWMKTCMPAPSTSSMPSSASVGDCF